MFGVPQDVVNEFVSRGAKWVGVSEYGVHVSFFSEPMVEVGYYTPFVSTSPFFIDRKWSEEFYNNLYVRRLTWGENNPPQRCCSCGQYTMITIVERRHKTHDGTTFESPGIYVDKCLECGETLTTTFESSFLGYHYWLQVRDHSGKWKSIRERQWFDRGFGL